MATEGIQTSNYLESFLADIGSSSLKVSSLDAKPALATHLSRIEQEITSVKSQIHETIHRDLQAFQSQYRQGLKLTSRLNDVESELGSLEQELERPETGLRPSLLNSLKNHARTAEDRSYNHQLVSLLSALQECFESVQTLDRATQEGRLDHAVDLLEGAERLLDGEGGDGKVQEWMKGTLAWQKCKTHLQKLRRTLEERLISSLEESFSRAPDGQAKFSIRLPASEVGVSLATALSTIPRLQPVEPHLSRLAKNILRHLVTPFLLHHGSPSTPGRERVSTDTETTVADFHFSVDQGTACITSSPDMTTTDGTDIFSRLIEFFGFLRDHLLSHCTPGIRHLFSLLLVRPTQGLIISHSLSTSLPSSTNGIQAFESLIPQALRFETKLAEWDLVTSSFDEDEPTQVLAGWVRDVPNHWARKYSERVYLEVRKEVLRKDWEVDVVDWDSDPIVPEREEEVPKERNPSESRLDTSVNHAASTVDQQPFSSTSHSHSEAGPTDDGWGFEDDTPPMEPPTTAPDTTKGAVPTPETSADGTTDGKRSLDLGEFDDEEDGWGFGDEVSSKEGDGVGKGEEVGGGGDGTEGDRKADTGEGMMEEDPDGWGFAEDDGIKGEGVEADAGGSSGSPPMPSTSSQPGKNGLGHGKKESLGGWGWDDEEEGSRPTEKRKPKISSKFSKRPPPPQHDDIIAPAVLPPTVEENPDSVSLSVGTPDPPPPPAPKVVEKVSISRQCRRIIKLAEEILDDVFRISSPEFPHKILSPASGRISRTFCDVFDLYRATTPVHHAELINTVPALGMQFANDCDWIAREAEKLIRSKPGGAGVGTESKSEAVKGLGDVLERTRKLAGRVRTEQVAVQRTALGESLDEARGFNDTSDDGVFATCQRCLKQVSYTLERLAHVWKPVMASRSFYETLGALVEYVLRRIITEIEGQPDISASESTRLADLVKSLYSLEDLFVVDGSSTIIVHVPSWLKYKFLSELLEASMVDIEFLHNEGYLVDFSPDELVRLIRALFAESPQRQRNIDAILRGERKPSNGT